MFLPLFPSINKLVLQLVAEDGWHLKVLATVAAMGPTKLVLAVVAAVIVAVVAVVAAIVAAVFQRHVVPGACTLEERNPEFLTEDARCLFKSGSSRWRWYHGTFF